ncbi:MAG: hypothetical protein ACSLEY_03975, partial [Candidatus Saccharimonadales bacterium]
DMGGFLCILLYVGAAPGRTLPLATMFDELRWGWKKHTGLAVLVTSGFQVTKIELISTRKKTFY